MDKKIIIIGAGMAGLSAGCYARMNGYEAEIYEMHDKPGGLCTSWKQKGYTFDGCIHWLWGSSPNHDFYRAWEELGAVQGRRMVDPDVFYRYNRSDGPPLTLYCDADKLEAHMKEMFPDDTKSIKLLCRLIRKLTALRMPYQKAYELYNIFDIIGLMVKMIPFYRAFNFCNKTTMEEYASRFKDPFLHEVFQTLLGEKDYTLMGLVITLALLQMRAGGYPVGGSLEFARAIEKRFLDLGGRIFYKKIVDKILEENGRAVGICLDDGTEIRGDYVISAADMRTTLYKMLGGKHMDPMHVELFKSVKLAPSTVQISFGANMDLSSRIECMGDLFKTGSLAGHNVDWLMLRNYAIDPTLAPPGRSVLICLGTIEDYEYWEKLSSDKKAYKAVKEKLATAAADFVDTIYPGFKSAIEVTDVVTPMTYVRYTGNFKGTYMTWIITPDKAKRFRLIRKTVPGLDNFWLSGMWVSPPGGLPSGVISSRHVIQIICRKDKKRFHTTLPAAT
jgi:phytoene dehydrogenase-like protein